MKKILVVVCVLGILFSSCRQPAEERSREGNLKGTLRIIHAGSLTVPVKEIADAYRKENPGVRILTEAWGSKAGARRISDLNQPCDVFISADYKVIDRFLIPEHATWNIPFAGNEMAIVYHEKSRHSGEIDHLNWHEILMREDVIYGRSDPNSDPCGVRAVLTCKLSERFYEIPGLAENILSRHLNFIRPKETDLLALLEKNAIDYIFLYRSVAEQHGLEYVILPDEINLKNPELNACYAEVDVEVLGTKPGETYREIGEAMVYGITIPDKTENPELALEFVKFFLTKDRGLGILKKNGQNPLVPYELDLYQAVPDELKKFVKPLK
jgi:molybdate/tungstate transport system substrate-binding protein